MTTTITADIRALRLPKLRSEWQEVAAFYRMSLDGLNVYVPKGPGAVSDLAMALYGPTAVVGHRSDRHGKPGHEVVCYVAASAQGPALPVLVPVPTEAP